METLTREKAASLFIYDNGILRWNVNRPNIKIGDEAGTKRDDGYIRVSVNGKLHLAHRIVFLMFSGEAPTEIDHADGNRSNNRFENLRVSTRTQNNYNRAKTKRNKSGFKGVAWDKKASKWRCQIKVNGKQMSLGTFDDAKDAAIVYAVNALRYHGEFSRY